MIILHTFPICVLVIEYIFISNIPFASRHYFGFCLPLVVAYLALNCYISLTDKPYYPFITWKGFFGIALPLLMGLSSYLIFKCIHILTRMRLISKGHHHILTITDGFDAEQPNAPSSAQSSEIEIESIDLEHQRQ